MKTIVSMSLLLLAGSTVFAAAPTKKSLAAYGHLSSLFTNPPAAPIAGPKTSVFDDWTLGGVSEVEGGYMVTLVHKKNAGETQVIRPRGTLLDQRGDVQWLPVGDPAGFKVERVDYHKESWKETTVVLSSGSKSATVGFDAKQLVPAKAGDPGQKLSPGQPGQQSQVQPRRAPIRSALVPPAQRQPR